MTIQALSQALDVSAETLETWIQELQTPIQFTETGELLNPEAWLPYFKQVKALFSAGRKATEIRQAVPWPEGLARPAVTASPTQSLQEVAHQLEMRIASLQFHLKNTQGEMIKEQKSIAKLQKQSEELQRTVDTLQRTLSGTHGQSEKIALFMSRFWLYQVLSFLLTLALVLIFGRFVFGPTKTHSTPQASPTARQGVLSDAGAGESSSEPAPVETPSPAESVQPSDGASAEVSSRPSPSAP